MAERATGTIFTAPVLVVRQQSKVLGVTNQYTLEDEAGETIGEVRQVDQGRPTKVLRSLFNPADRVLTFRLRVTDPDGVVVLQLTRPAKLVKSRMVVEDGQGNEVGQIVQDNAVGPKTFTVLADGGQIGKVVERSRTATDFVVLDRVDTEVARLTNTRAGLTLADLVATGSPRAFGDADSYVVQILQPIDQPLRGLVVAAALAIDVALNQV